MRNSLIVEVRSAEGGDDAKLLVEEQVAIYCKLGARRGL
jgi:protein subunit release factor A